MATSIHGTTVKIEHDPQNVRKFEIVVQVSSLKKPGLKSTVQVDPGKCNNKHHLLQLIGAAAAACAEYLDKYGDRIDPATCSKNALIAFGEEAKLLNAISQTSGAKIKRLREHVAKLSGADREKLLQMEFAANRAGSVTASDNDWLNRRIAEIHSNQLN